MNSSHASALLVLLLASAASAQDLTGRYELDGRYSTRRGTAVELTISGAANGMQVERTARFTGYRYRNLPPFTWTSSEVTQEGRLLRVTYTLDEVGNDLGLIHALDADRDPGSATVNAVREASLLRAYYRISSDGATLSELVVNATRRSSEDWWYWIRTSGARVGGVPTPPPTSGGFVDGFQARGITDPSLYYHFGVLPRDLPKLTDREATLRLASNPTDLLAGRIALVRTMIWENALRYRVNADGVIEEGMGTWRHGQVTDPNDGEVYDVVHWRDVDDNSFSVYWKGGALFSIYYEN